MEGETENDLKIALFIYVHMSLASSDRGMINWYWKEHESEWGTRWREGNFFTSLEDILITRGRHHKIVIYYLLPNVSRLVPPAFSAKPIIVSSLEYSDGLSPKIFTKKIDSQSGQ